MNIQEREELDFFPDTEHNNALAVSRQEWWEECLAMEREISAVLARGEVALVACGVAYCPRTDASLGTRRSLVSAHPSHEAAKLAMEEAINSDSPNSDYWFDLVSPIAEPQPVTPSETRESGEIPF